MNKRTTFTVQTDAYDGERFVESRIWKIRTSKGLDEALYLAEGKHLAILPDCEIHGNQA